MTAPTGLGFAAVMGVFILLILADAFVRPVVRWLRSRYGNQYEGDRDVE